MKLTTEQVTEFNPRGVIIAREVLTNDDLQPVLNELSARIDACVRTLHEEEEIADLQEKPRLPRTTACCSNNALRSDEEWTSYTIKGGQRSYSFATKTCLTSSNHSWVPS